MQDRNQRLEQDRKDAGSFPRRRHWLLSVAAWEVYRQPISVTRSGR